MASIKDVAKRAGVSISTVSNVINNTKYVSEELAEKINKAISELQYEVDPVARSLKSKKTMTIGVIITNINRIFFPQVIKGIQDTASKYGYNLTFFNSDDQLEKEKYFIQMLESSWVDGIILDSVADTDDNGYFKHLARLGNNKKSIPVISLERRIDNPGIDSVVVDNYLGGGIAARHLIECGCRRIAHVTGPMYSCMVKERLRGYKDETAKEKMPTPDEIIVEGDFSPLSGYQAVKKLLVSGIEFDGIFAANDQMAIGAIKAIKEHGFKVPEDIKVAGFDNTFVASIVDPSLTTINVPKYKMGVTAVEMLMERLNQNTEANVKPNTVELPINLIVRESSDLKGEKNWDLYGW